MFEIIKNNPRHKFYPVKPEEIQKAESNMGIIIPKELTQFYLSIGYGFLETRNHNINRIMGPNSVEEFYLGIGQFQDSEEVEVFNNYTRDKLIFFEVHDSLYLSMGITKLNKGKIYYYDEMIADDLNEFLERYLENERFFLTDLKLNN